MAKRSNRQKERDSKDANQKYYAELAKEDPTAVTRKEIITNAMKEKNVTITDLVKKTGLSIQSLMLFINGRTNISSKYVTTISNFLQLEPESIMKMPDLTSVAIHDAGLTMNSDKEESKETNEEKDKIENSAENSKKNVETENHMEDELKKDTEKMEKQQEAENEWIPSDMELNAILTLCTDIGKREAYHAIWNILQNPKCRKGAIC
jgi:transcriptional regulator with XRE-family HTH domain